MDASLTILNTPDHVGKFDGSQKRRICWDTLLTAKGLESITGSQEREQGIACDMLEKDLDGPAIIHFPYHSVYASRGTYLLAKEVKYSLKDQALHDELVSLMHQESLAKAHNDDQRIAFEEEKRRISIAKGKEHIDSTFTLSTANTPPQNIYGEGNLKNLCKREYKNEFHGELTFFLRASSPANLITIKPASTPIEAHKSLGKDEEGEDVDVHLYRSMIGCLMYLTASRPDIMFDVCVCGMISSHSKGFSSTCCQKDL
ncbi:hypothetical protein Tco_0624031 [Tanacetum coccineum]|uniref:Reverse transcriptase Ty1/copia-type domain-containing protein n=1 Tax=Tanacetum coccineum TaxID=301880 RepID=A0ABQ4WCX0_9ASTR